MANDRQTEMDKIEQLTAEVDRLCEERDRQAELSKRAGTPLVELIQYDGFTAGVYGGDYDEREECAVFRGRTREFFRSMTPGSPLIVRVLVRPDASRDDVLEQLRTVAEYVAAEWPVAEVNVEECPF
jgi:hypothetical protein